MNTKNMKKVLALALGFVMTLGLMPGMETKVLAAGKVASLTMKYYTYTSSGERTYGEYTPDVSEFTSLDAAFAAAADRTYLEKVGIGDDVAGKEHLTAIVKLLDNVTIAEGQTCTANGTFDLDLNGKTMTVNGTLTGTSDVSPDWPASISVASTKLGTFNSKGNIEVSLQPWTGDTFNITGGLVSGFFGIDGGTVNVSGGEFTGGFMANNGGDADINLTISKKAKIRDLEFYVYMDEDGNLAEGTHSIHMTLKGGYYNVDPSFFLKWDEKDQSKYVTLDTSKLEQYSSQTDWDADSSVYTYRVVDDSADETSTTETSSSGTQTSTGDKTTGKQTSTGTQYSSDVTAPGKVKLSSVKNRAKKTLTAKWKKTSGAKGYQVQYALDRKFTKGKKSKIVTKTSLKIKKLKKKKTYYVRVRAYKLKTNGKKKYGAWSAVKKVKIKK
ncbi:MAG: hypothetical protein K6G62_06470 [Eubacterium sp.]|nr:hypothetical protein [Eubacterium sp.]